MKFIKLLLIIALLNSSQNLCAQGSLVKKLFLNDRIQLSIPEGFSQIDKSEITLRFPNSEFQPEVILSDSNRISNIKIVVTTDMLDSKQVGQYKGWRVSKMLKDSSLNVISHDYKEINGVKTGIIIVEYKNLDSYSHYFFTSLDGRLLLVILDCTKEERKNREKTFHEIMNSLIIS